MARPAAGTNWSDALRSRPAALDTRPRRSVALQITWKHARTSYAASDWTYSLPSAPAGPPSNTRRGIPGAHAPGSERLAAHTDHLPADSQRPASSALAATGAQRYNDGVRSIP